MMACPTKYNTIIYLQFAYTHIAGLGGVSNEMSGGTGLFQTSSSLSLDNRLM